MNEFITTKRIILSLRSSPGHLSSGPVHPPLAHFHPQHPSIAASRSKMSVPYTMVEAATAKASSFRQVCGASCDVVCAIGDGGKSIADHFF